MPARKPVTLEEYAREERRQSRFTIPTQKSIARALEVPLAAVKNAHDAFLAIHKVRIDRRQIKRPRPIRERAAELRLMRLSDAWRCSIFRMQGWAAYPRLECHVGDPDVRIETYKVWSGRKVGGWSQGYIQPVVHVTHRNGVFQDLKAIGIPPTRAVHKPLGVAGIGSGFIVDATIHDHARFHDDHSRTVAIMEATLLVLRGPRTLRLERGWLVIRTTEFGSVTHFTGKANAAWKTYGVERDLAANGGHIAIAERAARLAEEIAEEERVAQEEAALEAALDELVDDFAVGG